MKLIKTQWRSVLSVQNEICISSTKQVTVSWTSVGVCLLSEASKGDGEFSTIHTHLLITEQANCAWEKLDLHVEKSQSGVEEVLIFTVTSGNPERTCYGESRANAAL